MPDAETEITQSAFIDLITNTKRLKEDEVQRIKEAFAFGANCHKGQKRISGKDYFMGHCVHVGARLYELEMSANMIIAGLLHDVIEDTETSRETIEEVFGEEVAFLVDGVSHLGTLKYKHYKRHIASLRKFFVAVAKDARVIVIKICDRLHNLQTLHHLPVEKQKRIAEESMLIHAQLAERLHMTALQQEINDLAFPYVFAEDFQKVKALQKASLSKANKVIEVIYRQCLMTLSQNLGYQPIIDKRVKSRYSLYKKLMAKDWNIEAIYDIIALRIIVESEKDCYQALGVIHAQWQPLQNRFKDYIAAPKTNGYQSLHTTIFSGEGHVIEIQIKTQAMQRFAQFGLASHVKYKDGRTSIQAGKTQFGWQDQLKHLEHQANANIKNYLEELKTDFFVNRIFVMTPEGDVIDLPQGATVLDFAFAIHTELGVKAKGGRINGIYKALRTPLEQQDIVEIITDKKVKAQKSWLNWAKTAHARKSLRAYLQNTDDKT